MKRKLLSLALLAGLSGAAFPLMAQPMVSTAMQAAVVNVPDPASQIEDLARRFRAGDLAGLLQAAVPPAKWEEIRLGYELARLEHSEEDRARFAEEMERFTAPDAVDRIMAEIEPKLEEARPQAAGAMLMAFGAMQMAVSSPESELTDEQRAALQAALPAIQRWAGNTDFLSSDRMREALTLLTDAARRSGVADVEQLRNLPLEAMLDRAGTVFVAGKEAVRLYGIDLDAIADSLQVEVLSLDGETARVRATVMLFDVPVWSDHDLVLIDGRWYGKEAVSHLHVHDEQVEG